MPNLSISKLVYPSDITMSKPHNHDYYELYFLLDGNREVFIENKLFVLEKNSLVVIPPFVMHKTGGGAFTRINIAVPPEALTREENELLTELYSTGAVQVNEQHRERIFRLLDEGADIQTNYSTEKDIQTQLAATLRLVLFYLSLSRNQPVTPYGERRNNYISSDVLKVIHYLNGHYNESITLREICDHFFLSKATLCKNFKKYMNCSVMDYILELRIQNAKRMLQQHDGSIESVAAACGFSSANYFRTIFKQHTGLSPLKYRKFKWREANK